MSGTPTTAPVAGAPVTGAAGTVRSYGAYVYWILGLIVSVGLGYVLYKLNYQIAAVLVFLGAVVSLFYYYVYWFLIPSNSNVWPPNTTPCPDFLTLVNPGANGTTAQCMDYVGVSANGNLLRADPKKQYNPMTDQKYYFNIDRTKPYTTQCQNASQYGLTWSTVCPE
jgi:hypothetical protein